MYYSTDELEKSVMMFKKAADDFTQNIQGGQMEDYMRVRSINDILIKIHQVFVIPEGLPGRPTVRNVLSAPSQFDNYASSGFPGLSDLLHKIDKLSTKERTEREKKLKRHISDLTIMTNRAISMLKETHLI